MILIQEISQSFAVNSFSSSEDINLEDFGEIGEELETVRTDIKENLNNF